MIIDLYFKDPAAWRTGGHPDGEDRWRLVRLGQLGQQAAGDYVILLITPITLTLITCNPYNSF